MKKINKLNFQPFPFLSSGHFQTVLSVYRSSGSSPPSHSWRIDIGNGDQLSCEISKPSYWTDKDRTIVLIHGLGGSHSSVYMIRLARKFYGLGYKVVRINLRGCGSGEGLSKLPYHAGNSQDVLKVLKALKDESPHSPITLIGFSLGGNIVLKLAGELEAEAESLLHTCISICPPVDLVETIALIERKRYRLYHSYYLQKMCEQARPWVNKKYRTMREFDNGVTAPLWNFKDANDYYVSCSSLQFLKKIQVNTHILLAEDDPFIPCHILNNMALPEPLHVWQSSYGGHLGFIGKTKEHGTCWLDYLLHNWISGDFVTTHLR